MSWDTLLRAAYDTAAINGFHAEDSTDPVIARLQATQRLFLIVSEITEALDELRAGRNPTEVYLVEGKPEGVPIELADAVLRIADFAATEGIDLGHALFTKMAYNRGRPYLHGKAF